MKKWQKERNYRRVKDENGTIIANIITVDGIDVEVTDEVFRAYSTGDRKERYQDEQRDDSAPDILSFEELKERNVPIDLYIKGHEVSAETIALDHEDELELATYRALLQDALALLSEEERDLIHALFFERLSTRAYAKQLGVYQRAVIYRRDKVLKKLREKIFLKKT